MTSVKLTALFLALLLAVSLAACGNPIRDVVIGKDPVITPSRRRPSPRVAPVLSKRWRIFFVRRSRWRITALP